MGTAVLAISGATGLGINALKSEIKAQLTEMTDRLASAVTKEDNLKKVKLQNPKLQAKNAIAYEKSGNDFSQRASLAKESSDIDIASVDYLLGDLPSIQGKCPDIIFYGGSFNPPHCGHLQVIEAVTKRWPEAAILISVTPIPNVLGDTDKQRRQTSLNTRQKWCELAFENVLNQPNINLTAIESTLPAPQRSVATLEALKKKLSSSHLWTGDGSRPVV